MAQEGTGTEAEQRREEMGARDDPALSDRVDVVMARMEEAIPHAAPIWSLLKPISCSCS